MNADAVAALPWGEYIAKLAATPCLAFREPWSCLNEPEEDGSPEAPMWERDELCPPCLVRAARAALAAAPLPSEPREAVVAALRAEVARLWALLGYEFPNLVLDALAAAPLPSEPTHPHDGFAYDGCKCVCCVNIRALANPAIIEERDRAEEWADRLAYAIGGAAIGEHSNLNNPWQNALDMAAPLPSEPETTFAWLIERGQPERQVPTVWWWLAAGGREGWTEVASEAFRFESREAAEEIITAKFTPLARARYGGPSARAVEHGFHRGAPLPSDTPARTMSFDSVNATGRPSDTPADELDVERLIYAVHQAINGVPAMVVTNTEYVPQAKRRADAVVDRHRVIVAVRDAIREYAALALTQEPRSGDDR